MFELAPRKRNGTSAVLVAFDLLDLEGVDLRHLPIEHRKAKLAKLIRRPRPGIVVTYRF